MHRTCKIMSHVLQVTAWFLIPMVPYTVMYCRSLHFKNYFQKYDYDIHSLHSITTHFIPKIMMNKVKKTCKIMIKIKT